VIIIHIRKKARVLKIKVKGKTQQGRYIATSSIRVNIFTRLVSLVERITLYSSFRKAFLK
jgi:hypothetical protein